MSSGSPSQIVHEVGGPCAPQPEQPVDGQAASACPAGRAARASTAARAACSPGGSDVEDLVERPRVVAELDALEPGERRVRRLVVALDRRGLAEPGDAVVPDLDLDDLGLVLRRRARS